VGRARKRLVHLRGLETWLDAGEGAIHTVRQGRKSADAAKMSS